MSTRRRRGVTLIEVLITIVISAIALFALVPPFLAEGSFFRKGKRQTEAQRDAQMVLRAMARATREGSGYDPATNKFTVPCGLVWFERHAADGTLHQHGCLGDVPLIDGAIGRSKATSFTVTPIIANRLVQIGLTVTHQLRPTDPNTESENLVTELFLRNG